MPNSLKLDRRSLVKSCIGAALGHMLANGLPAYADSEGETLKTIARRHGIILGVQVEPALLQVPELSTFITENFDLVTPGNQLKWGVLCPASSIYNFKDADSIFRFAQANQMRVHGHTLCWNQANPGWFTSTLTQENARDYLEAHIRTVGGRYKGQVESWDVVNEPIRAHAKRPDGMTTGPWLDLLGPEYIDIAFHTAASVDPSALRVLNLDNTEQAWQGSDSARANSLELIRNLLHRGVPIQAVGLQSHLEAPIPVMNSDRTEFIRALKDLGLEILLTELDVNDTRVQGSDSERRQVVASYYGDYLRDVLSVAKPKRVIFWSFCDRYNWYDWAAKRNVLYARSDGAIHFPGLLTSDMQPAPALDAVRNALR